VAERSSVAVRPVGRRGPRPASAPSPRVRSAVLGAAHELIEAGGFFGLTVDGLVDSSGVSKATIYRWWPTKETLALDALYTEWSAAAPVPRDTNSLRGDLVELMAPWARLVTAQPYARVIAALLAKTRADPAFAAEYRQRVIEPRRDQAREIFHRAVERGELQAGIDLEVALDLIYGPLYLRLLQDHAPLDDAFVEAAIDLALTGIEPAPAAG